MEEYTMEVLKQILMSQGLGFLLGVVSTLGLPPLVRFLRADANKKLTDNDPKNDWEGHLEEGLADIAEKEVPKLVKDVDKIVPKK